MKEGAGHQVGERGAQAADPCRSAWAMLATPMTRWSEARTLLVTDPCCNANLWPVYP